MWEVKCRSLGTNTGVNEAVMLSECGDDSRYRATSWTCQNHMILAYNSGKVFVGHLKVARQSALRQIATIRGLHCSRHMKTVFQEDHAESLKRAWTNRVPGFAWEKEKDCEPPLTYPVCEDRSAGPDDSTMSQDSQSEQTKFCYQRPERTAM